MQSIKVGIGVLLVDHHRILLGHRTKSAVDTGGIYEPDSWCLPGGKQEYHETIFEGAARETKEETNLTIHQMKIFSAADDIQPAKHYVTIHVIAYDFEGTLKVMEPDKQDAWEWFDLDNLPDRIYSPSRQFIEAYLASIQSDEVKTCI